MPPERRARVDIVNPFEPGHGDVLRFPEGGFEVRDVVVDGRRVSFAGYLEEHHVDTRMPLVTDRDGALVNVSLEMVDPVSDVVTFHAPVFPEVAYRMAKPIGDYVSTLAACEPAEPGTQTFSACSMLNYVYGQLAGRPTGLAPGPVTFGEVAHQLLNQTLVTLTIE
ncbi:MAG: hypothetical protein AAF602_17465 [Myxococcota bacterium]